MENILKNYRFGNFIAILYKIFWFYKSDNTENFFKANISKIILCDPRDVIVNDFSSLKSSMSIKYIQKFFPQLQDSILKYCLEHKHNYDHFIDILYLCYSNISDNLKIIRKNIKNISIKRKIIKNNKQKIKLAKKNKVKFF